MKIKKWSLVLLLVLVVLIGAGWLFLNQIRSRAIPDYNENIRLKGLDGTVEVLRDSLGIPHVFAVTEHDLYIAVGYLEAQDRLWQMDLLRRVTTGRLSEIFGKDMIDEDQLFRSLRITEKSRMILAEASPELRSALDAFCSGVNQYMEENGKKLPPEFALLGYKPDPWLPEHSINLIGYMAWDLSTGWTTETLIDQIRRQVGDELYRYLLPDLTEQRTYVQPGFTPAVEPEALANLAKTVRFIEDLGLDVFRGSNNWAVAGKKSATGQPILANDMHLSLWIPGIWYQMHQVVPGKLDVTGVILPGQPLVVAGHNVRIAWGYTNVMTDDADFYEETINPADSTLYRFNGEWKKLDIREEKIFIKGGDSVIRTNAFTHRGPVISDFKKTGARKISMRWNGMEPSNELRSIFLLNRAGNWEEFREALKTFVAVNQNVVYADVDGNIGMQSTIGLPVRKGTGTTLFPGDTDEFDWKGLVPFEELPYTYNPECGYVSSANNNTVGPDYPHYISSWFSLPYRADRILEMLNEKEKLSVDDFIRMQADHKSKMAGKFTPEFLNHILVNSLTGDEKTALDKLAGWNLEFESESSPAAIFDLLYHAVLSRLAKDQMGDDLFTQFRRENVLVTNFMENILRDQSSTWCDDITTTERQETFSEMVTDAFKQTVADLTDQLGTNQAKWEWGKIHTFTIKHPMAQVKLINKLFGLSRGPYAVGGSFHTVHPFSYPLGDPAGVDDGSSQRHIYDLADWDRSLSVIPTGVCGVPASPYYCNQTEMYVKNLYHADVITRARIEARKQFRMEFGK